MLVPSLADRQAEYRTEGPCRGAGRVAAGSKSPLARTSGLRSDTHSARIHAPYCDEAERIRR
jgi:hypothetical protein